MFGLVEDFILFFFDYLGSDDFIRWWVIGFRFVLLPARDYFWWSIPRSFFYATSCPIDKSAESHQYQNNADTDIAQVTNTALDNLVFIYRIDLMMSASAK